MQTTNSSLRKRIILLIPAFWACIFDEGITIIKQKPEYWAGNLAAANERNPIGAVAMSYHVSGIFIVSALWLIIIGIIGALLPVRFLKTYALFITLIHAWGASTWLSHHYGFWWVVIFMAINSVLFVRMDEIYSKPLPSLPQI